MLLRCTKAEETPAAALKDNRIKKNSTNKRGVTEKEAGRWVVGRHFHLSEL